MTTYCGKDGVVKFATNTVAEVREFSVSETGDVADSTSMDNTDGWKTHKGTLKEWSGTMTCYWDDTDTTGQGALDLHTTGAVELYPGGDASGRQYLSGTITVTGIETGTAVDGLSEATISFQGNGPLTKPSVA